MNARRNVLGLAAVDRRVGFARRHADVLRGVDRWRVRMVRTLPTPMWQALAPGCTRVTHVGLSSASGERDCRCWWSPDRLAALAYANTEARDDHRAASPRARGVLEDAGRWPA